ncbi:MAG: orotidine-5'-phosphate decarboxylase [Muribaculaceae bacterium]|nr:orotidine-5'-phosphate decarboxylase [Muribaculaceae bacterium]
MKRTQLVEKIFEKGTFLCVGLDPDSAKMPPCLAEKGCEGLLEFNKNIIDATAQYCVAYKPNLAFYEAFGSKGYEVFVETCAYIRNNYPEHMIIADAKRGDIGNTARMYAKALYEGAGVDAVTLAPYMGEDSVKPFLSYEDKWAIVLALTSNASATDFEMVADSKGVPLFERVIRRSRHWGSPVNMMYVVGATKAEFFDAVRAVAPRHFLLVPGVGAQGGSLEDVCRHGMIDECGLLVNSSRGIIHASQGDDYAEAAAEAARVMAEQMTVLLAEYAK